MRDRKIHEDLIKKGYSRIQEKIKKIRQYFSEAVISGFLKFFCCLQIRLKNNAAFLWSRQIAQVLVKEFDRNNISNVLTQC